MIIDKKTYFRPTGLMKGITIRKYKDCGRWYTAIHMSYRDHENGGVVVNDRASYSSPKALLKAYHEYVNCLCKVNRYPAWVKDRALAFANELESLYFEDGQPVDPIQNYRHPNGWPAFINKRQRSGSGYDSNLIYSMLEVSTSVDPDRRHKGLFISEIEADFKLRYERWLRDLAQTGLERQYLVVLRDAFPVVMEITERDIASIKEHCVVAE